MAEAAGSEAATNPHEVLLVVDALTGQDAVNTATAFNERLGVTGIVMTRVDGDGRGGAPLSMRAVTGKPIKLIGVGEKVDALEDFHPSRIANRILGMGEIVSLVERARKRRPMSRRRRWPPRCRRASSISTTCAASSSRWKSSAAWRRDGHAARHRQDEGCDGEREDRRPADQAAGATSTP